MKQEHTHESHQGDGHGYQHATPDPQMFSSERGKQAVKWSFAALMFTALLQSAVVFLSGSVALLADTLHNFGDAFTALPLWIAFHLSRRKPSRRFTYGWGRLEDLAGIFIIAVILGSAVAAGYESVRRFSHPRAVEMLGAVAAAALIGFVGNEVVARFRIRVGREIKSAALEADGYHARIDGLTSLGVLFSVVGLWLGYSLTDPLVGLLITAAILKIVWDAGRRVLMRLLDGVDPSIIDDVRQVIANAEGVREVSDIRARWVGHQLHAEVNLAVTGDLSVAEAHRISENAHHAVLSQLPYLSNLSIHVDPLDKSGESFHSQAH
jgi:cation diffusion facilitator family transporter